MAQKEEPGFLERVASHIGERLKAIPSEVAQTVTDKMIPQGAAELAQALNAGNNAYVPYGTAQRPLEVEGPMQNYTEMLRESSQRQQPDQDRGPER